LTSNVVLKRESKELEMKMQDTFQTQVDGLQQKVRLLQQRFYIGSLVVLWYNISWIISHSTEGSGQLWLT